MMNEAFRIETDSLGPVKVPAGAYWGPQTQRAIENFPVSGLRFGRPLIRALGMVKGDAARVHAELGLLEKPLAEAIGQAADEVADGRLDDQFVVDVYQTGSGTSTHMNANEVIASRANEILGGKPGDRHPVHPNDHVNRGQSSNDVFPSAIHLAAALELRDGLLPALDGLQRDLQAKAGEFAAWIKTGRTHLQDATPVTLGQEFSGYARQVELAGGRLGRAALSLHELPLGGTAVGTGINTHPRFAALVIARLAARTGLPLAEARNHFEAQAARDAVVEASGALRVAAVSLSKIANDIRWLGSGPRLGLGELILPELQPGSSIMPGKVNPVLAETLLQVCAQVIGNDAAIAIGGLSGNFELNTMMPLLAHNLLQSVALLTRSVNLFAARLVRGLRADPVRCRESAERNLALATALAPRLGYDRAAAIVREAWTTGETVRAVARRRSELTEPELDSLLDPAAMLGAR